MPTGSPPSDLGSLWDRRKRTDALLQNLVGRVSAAAKQPRKKVLTIDQMLDAYEESLKLRGKRSVGSFRSHVRVIRAKFGKLRASDLTSAMLDEFTNRQWKAGLKPATVNRGLQALRAAYRLAVKRETLFRVPHFTLLDERDNVRRGFLEPADFERVAAKLPESTADAVRFMYATGWRRSEVINLRWENVDRAAQEVQLFQAKAGPEGRVLPLVGELAATIERRWQAKPR